MCKKKKHILVVSQYFILSNLELMIFVKNGKKRDIRLL